MENAGEELVGNYLRWVMKCDFVEYNLNTKHVQGEIDVVGIDLGKKLVYICEVATHLETGLQYVKDGQSDNVDRFTTKFGKDIEYANEYFPDYTKIFMLWSPIVKSTKEGSKHNQIKDVEKICEILNEKFNINLELMINEKFFDCIQQLRTVAKEKTHAMPTTIMRFLQIDEKTKAYVKKNYYKSNKIDTRNEKLSNINSQIVGGLKQVVLTVFRENSDKFYSPRMMFNIIQQRDTKYYADTLWGLWKQGFLIHPQRGYYQWDSNNK